MAPDRRRIVLLATPPVLLGTMLVAFRVFARLLGPKAGYLAGFGLYWIVWCVGVPFAVLGGDGVRRVFRRVRQPLGRPALLGAVSLALPVALGYGYAFSRAVGSATPVEIGLSAALALLNGPLEELLWRGSYADVFVEPKLAAWYPSIGFALWHLAPLSIVPNRAPGGAASFVLASGVIGLLWGRIAAQTRSIRATTIAHILLDFSGLGGRGLLS